MAAVPFVDLKTQYARIANDVKARIDAVLEHGQFILGPEVAEAESALAAYVGVTRAVTVGSGTEALMMPLMSRGVGPGDAIFVPTFTFIATAEVVSLLGATPVFVDVDPVTFNLDPASLIEAIGRVKAEGRLVPKGIMPVDLFGLPADYDAIDAVATAEGMFVLEDACQGFGGERNGVRAGSFGFAGGTSFFPAKPLAVYGDGGAIFTDDDDLADTMLSIRTHGFDLKDRYEHVRIGINGRFDTMQAAVLLAKMAIFPDEVERRRMVAGWYDEALAGLVTTPTVPGGYASAWAQYSVLSDRRETLRAALTAAGIPTAVYYPKPLHRQPVFENAARPVACPVADELAGKVFSLPMGPYVTEEIVATAAAAIQGA
jgi:dTDP-4-amino-4,6-dideoxygalactose transaminase